MNSIESLDIKERILKYGKYVIILLIILILFLVFKGCNEESKATIEKDVIKAAEKYVKENNMNITGETYIELDKLETIDGTELCTKASGVIVKNNNGSLEYTPYLKCNDYEATSDNKNKYISLVGEETVILNKGEIYEEQNYTLKEEADVVISGAVGNNPGVYNITYDVYIDGILKETVVRKVIRIAGDKTETISGITDVDIPVLTLKGDIEITLYKGERFEEPSWTAYDYTDGVLNTKVKRTITYNNKTVNRVDTSKTGIYRILYSVTNSKGNTAYRSRIINVIEKSLDLKVNLSSNTNEIASSATITINITGKDYAYMYLPSGEKTTERTRTITVKENRTYAFNVYDQYGTRYDKEIEISNLDNIPPTGTCKALVRGKNTEVEVTATDNKGVAGYSYILDSNATSYFTSSTYKVAIASEKVSVKVKDIASNETTINCEVTIKKETTVAGRASGSSRVINTGDYRLVATKNDVMNFANLLVTLKVNDQNFPGTCLSFAYYYAYQLYGGTNLNSMKASDGAVYKYATRFKKFENDDKSVVLEKIYEQINGGKPVVLHVNGNLQGTSRHYVTVVGYKARVTSKEMLTEEDLLVIDTYDGYLERMDRKESRFMITGYATGRKGANGYGYQILILV